ncbi:MAG: nucleotidyl transferase AbiEii/AbiGii toxin family protein, partial [Lachnospiraceae bacterium]|nr:nucleotidyl transferase AbiEii/AbiGii toxin family protein [Lachnospiraceae bacterium]
MSLTEGHIARHTPTGSGAPGREAAIIDIAQDFLLSYLEDSGKMEKVSLKGGTAIRKFYAGREGRFSLDLDFAIDDKDLDSDEVAFDFVSEIDGLKLGPFTYSISERRNKWYVGLSSPYNDGEIYKTKLDFASYPWLEPARRGIVQLPIHK